MKRLFNSTLILNGESLSSLRPGFQFYLLIGLNIDQSESMIENRVSIILSIQNHRVISDILFMEQKNFIGNKSEAFYQNDMIF